MRLPRVRFTTQQLMVVIVLVAILSCGAIEVIPDLIRRWIACREAALGYSVSARYYAKGNPDDSDPRTQKIRYREQAAYCLKRSRDLRRALYLPWELYWLEPSEIKW